MKTGEIDVAGKKSYILYFDTYKEMNEARCLIEGRPPEALPEDKIARRIMEMVAREPQQPNRMIHNICRSALVRDMGFVEGESRVFARKVMNEMIDSGQIVFKGGLLHPADSESVSPDDECDENINQEPPPEPTESTQSDDLELTDILGEVNRICASLCRSGRKVTVGAIISTLTLDNIGKFKGDIPASVRSAILKSEKIMIFDTKMIGDENCYVTWLGDKS